MITAAELKRIMPYAKFRADTHVDALNAAMLEFEINNPLREAAFLAQVAHESGELRYMRELASGSAYDTGPKALALGNTPEDDDDGEKYRGRSYLQITGKFNYERYGILLGLDLVNHPEVLEQPVPGARASACFWQTNGLNELADKEDFLRITKRINGGTTHYKERLAYYERAKYALSTEGQS